MGDEEEWATSQGVSALWATRTLGQGLPKPKHQDQHSNNTGRNTDQRPSSNSKTTGPQGKNPSSVRCFNWNELGHYASSCTKRSMYCGQPEGGADRARRHGTINGVYCADILVDTGATQTLVRKDLVTADDILNGEVTIRCAHGDTASYPLAAVKINIGGKDIIMTAGVSSTLPASALLGWEIPELLDFDADRGNVKNSADALAVMTRLRRRQQQEALDLSCQEVAASPNEIEGLHEPLGHESPVPQET